MDFIKNFVKYFKSEKFDIFFKYLNFVLNISILGLRKLKEKRWKV